MSNLEKRERRNESRQAIEPGMLRAFFEGETQKITGLSQKELISYKGAYSPIPKARRIVSINTNEETMAFFGTVDDVLSELPELRWFRPDINVSFIKPGHKNNGPKMTLDEYVSVWGTPEAP